MQILLSPAKTLDFETPSPTEKYSHPLYLDKSAQLIEICRQFDVEALAQLMKISPKIAQLNVERFQQWRQPFTPENAKQALFALSGEVYQHLDATTLSADSIAFANQHLRILSGLYGLLRPLDLIQPYRLEMGTKLANSAGKNLYQFWQTTLTDALNAAPDTPIVNLASQEYFKAIDAKKLRRTVLTPTFKDEKKGRYKVISFYAKRARGRFARWLLAHRITDPARLPQFQEAGYRYDPGSSDATTLVFRRSEAMAAQERQKSR